ncbi:UNVERIFIED_CONTAM: hypothetical protein Slati_1405400 [Sesamum latifolium]|uniref:Transposase n=1 Tax=Sesamum latifolium TaxID=2727402 RepID=A0AAW2X4Y9_9LAMI
MLLKNKEALIEAVKDHSIRHARREYYVTESSKTKWKVLCKQSTPDIWCRWELQEILKSKLRRWSITKYGGPYVVYVASLLLGQVKCNPTYAIKHVIQTVKDHTGYDIPYQKAWYSLKMVREIIFGTWEGEIQKLPKYMGALKKYNRGTIVEWKHKTLQPTGAYVMGYIIWAFKSCIEGFQFCRKIISVDGTHLYKKYKHKMLIAATMDGNQQDLYWRADSEYQIRKFNRIMEEIKSQKLEAFTFLDGINKEKWTASHDGGWRCGILTTNMSKCINEVLKGARRLPMTAIVEIMLQRTADYFRERALKSGVMLSNGQLWTDFAKKKFTHWGEKSINHTVTKYNHLQQSASIVTKRQQGPESTPMFSNLPTGYVHAANGLNLNSLALTLKKYALHTILVMHQWLKNIMM